MNLRLLPLDAAQTKEVYDRWMKTDFPPEELKPYASMAQMMEKGWYEPLALLDGTTGAMAAYAFQTVMPGCRCALLDYFAVLPDRRGHGTGTAALTALAGYYRERMDALIIECEHPAEAPDPETARRRIGFYLRAGARTTAIESRLFGVRYLVLALPCGDAVSDEAVNADLRRIYRLTVPEPYYRGNVIFYGG